MDKATFIISLLDNKKLNPEQRLKVLELAKRDYASTEGRIAEILDRIQHIENEVGLTAKPKHGTHRFSLNAVLGEDDFLESVDFDNILFPEPPGNQDKALRTTRKNKTNKKQKLSLKDIQEPANEKDEANEPNEYDIGTENTDINDVCYPIYHNPKKTVELLNYFTANDKNLKYATHSWEEGKFLGYDDFFEKIKDEWNSINEEMRNQSVRLHAKISNFLLNNKLGTLNEKKYYHAWGENRLKFGWASPEIRKHMETPGKSPFSCEIPERIKALDKNFNLQYFNDYANVFKNEIEFREDTKNLKKIILDLWEKHLTYDFEIGTEDLKRLDGCSFFTDVHLIKEALLIIFRDMFKKKPEYNKVKIERISNFKERYHMIKITQVNSFVTRSVEDIKFTEPTGDLAEIIKLLYNICDYSLVSRFDDGNYYRLNYLSSDKKDFKELLHEELNVVGFTHEFRFYLNVNEKSNSN
ncbi:MAG: hypothetical protein ACK5FT_08305 [Sphingomonadales bacterium]|jgi:hypothetical protein